MESVWSSPVTFVPCLGVKRPNVFKHEVLTSIQASAGRPRSGVVDTREVRFTQDSISAFFGNGKSINDVIRTGRGPDGADLATHLEPIRLVEWQGQLWTLDNRRLAAFAAAGQEVPYRMATPAEMSKEWARKFTTTAEQGWGRFTTVAPPPGWQP